MACGEAAVRRQACAIHTIARAATPRSASPYDQAAAPAHRRAGPAVDVVELGSLDQGVDDGRAATTFIGTGDRTLDGEQFIDERAIIAHVCP
jgi:hypothetical protein